MQKVDRLVKNEDGCEKLGFPFKVAPKILGGRGKILSGLWDSGNQHFFL